MHETKKICYVTVGGRGTLTEKAYFLSKSICHIDPNAEIYVYIPKDEKEYCDKNYLKKLEINRNIKIIFGKKPMEEYPISSKIAAMDIASRYTNRKYILLLDTDTLMVGNILHILNPIFDLYLKPVDIGRQYWGSKFSENDWRLLYKITGFEFPTYKIKSTVDKKSIYPYWNAGFVLTRDKNFGKKWLNVLEEIFPYMLKDSKRYFSDQVALAILSSSYNIKILDEKYNYPLHLRLYIPNDVKVLHYHKYIHLRKIFFFSNDILPVLQKIGIAKKIPNTSLIRLIIGYIVSRMKLIFRDITRYNYI